MISDKAVGKSRALAKKEQGSIRKQKVKKKNTCVKPLLPCHYKIQFSLVLMKYVTRPHRTHWQLLGDVGNFEIGQDR